MANTPEMLRPTNAMAELRGANLCKCNQLWPSEQGGQLGLIFNGINRFWPLRAVGPGAWPRPVGREAGITRRPTAATPRGASQHYC